LQRLNKRVAAIVVAVVSAFVPAAAGGAEEKEQRKGALEQSDAEALMHALWIG
jgi:hypothetical protein